jgi:hypothetical protein
MSDPDTKMYQPRTYGNWIEPRTPGIVPGLGLLGSGLVFAGIFLALPFMMLNLFVPAISIFLLTSVFAYLISRKDVHGKSMATKFVVKCGWLIATWKRENMFRGGILGYGPSGSMILPGLLARTQLLRVPAPMGEFGVVYCPRQHTYTLVIRASPNGEDLVDDEQVDRWVAKWAQSKSQMSDEQGLLQYTVTVETAPANPLRLRQEVAGQADQDEPDFAASVMGSIVDSYPQGSSQANAYVAFTYTDRRVSGRRRSRDVMLAELSSRLPYLMEKLQSTGAGACSPMDPAALCRYVRIAYDPEQAEQFDLADMQGVAVDLAWRNCGPMATQASWDTYRHDSGLSETWEMSMTPKGVVQATILKRLLVAQQDLLRKRVTWIFRPIPAEKKPDVVDRDVNQADYAVNSSKKPKPRDKRRARAVNQTAEEESSGAGLENFSCLVTITMDGSAQGDDRADVASSVENLGASARLRLRPVYGSQDSAFAAALPLGLSLREYQAVPAKYSDML